jgi:hypothetical protein
MTIRELAAALGVSNGSVVNWKRQGMPDGIEEARAWVKHRGRRRGDPPAATVPIEVPAGEYNLADTVPRLRMLEENIAKASAQAYREGKLSEAISLRREHVSAIRAVYEAESKLVKIQEMRGKLIPVEKALAIVNNAIQSGIVVLRRLPELGKTPEERRRLEAFLNAVLTELKDGAAAGAKL